MIKTVKFGGTSVGSAANMRRVAQIITDQGARLSVLSAMSGSTDALVGLAGDALQSSLRNSLLDFLREKYTTCIEELLAANKAAALERMENAFSILSNAASSAEQMIAQGELLTSAIFCLYMQEAGYRAELLHAPDFVRTDGQGRVDAAFLGQTLSRLATDPDTYYITQGFICTDAQGRLGNLGRGGSDYSAALMGVAIGAGQVQIWTDIDGMHNNDPRYVEGTRPIRRMSFDQAAELAYFGAKILHPATIQPCKAAGIDVWLKNSLQPQAEGTLITAGEEDTKQLFHAVAAKDGITVVRLRSARMLMAYGFLRKMFEVFELYGTSVDMVTTSEVEVSLTIDNTQHLDEIIRDLEPLGAVEVERENTIVCIVGSFGREQHGVAARIFEGLGEIPIKMISYGAAARSIAILVAMKDKKRTLQALNDRLF